MEDRHPLATDELVDALHRHTEVRYERDLGDGERAEEFLAGESAAGAVRPGLSKEPRSGSTA